MKPENLTIYSDVDGTLSYGTADTAVINEKNLASLQKFILDGGRFGIASGRNHQSVRNVLKDIDINMPVVESNGAAVYDLKLNKNVVELYLDKEFKKFIYEFVRDRKNLGLSALNKSYSHQMIMNDERDDNHLDYPRPLMNYEQFINEDIYKVAIVAEKKSIDDALKMINHNTCFNYVAYARSADIYIEFFNKSAGKWNGIKSALKYTDLKNRKLVCIGDHFNDIEMLKNADIAICPDNAVQEVKECVHKTVCRCQEGAIWEAIEYLRRL